MLQRIFAIPALLALLIVGALVLGLVGDPKFWPAVWGATGVPLAIIAIKSWRSAIR